MIYIFAITSVILSASLGVIVKYMLGSMSPIMLMTTTMFALSILLFIVSMSIDGDFLNHYQNAWKLSWKWIIVFSVINFASFFLFNYVLLSLPVAHFQLISIMMPVFGGVLAYYFLGEKISQNFLFALPFFLIGIYILTKN